MLRCALCLVACLVIAACTRSEAGMPEGPQSPSPTWATPGDPAEPIMIAPAGATPPPFPDSVEGYSLSQEWRTTVRAFDGPDWSTTGDFPATMNGCGLQRFYIRWRAANPGTIVEATFLSTDGIVLGESAAGGAGWMSGYGCGQPAFRMESSNNTSTLVDVVVEIQQWEIAV